MATRVGLAKDPGVDGLVGVRLAPALPPGLARVGLVATLEAEVLVGLAQDPLATRRPDRRRARRPVIALRVVEPSPFPVELEGLGHLDAGALVVRPSGQETRVLHAGDQQLVEEHLHGQAHRRSGGERVGIVDRLTAPGPGAGHEGGGAGARLGDPDGAGVGEEAPSGPVGHDRRRRGRLDGVLLDCVVLDCVALQARRPHALGPNTHSSHGT